ncbi:transcriptional regulator, partial [Phocaeicola vulgatus]
MNIETHTHEHWFALKVFYNKVFEIEDILKKDK